MSFLKQFQKRVVVGAALLTFMAAFGNAQAAGIGSFSRVFGLPSPAFPSNLLAGPDLVVNLAGIISLDGLGATGNTLLMLNAQPGTLVDQFSWSLNLSTIGESWLSEATVVVTNSNGDGVLFSPGLGDDFTGIKAYADGASLVSLNLDFNILADGMLFVEFFESFDDNIGAADATYLSGNLSFTGIGVIPEPGTYGLMALGLIGLSLVAHRRRQT